MIIRLRPQEFRVWRLGATGLCAKEIAAKLGICRATVWKIRETLFAELRVNNAVKAAVQAYVYRILELPKDKRGLTVTKERQYCGRGRRWGR